MISSERKKFGLTARRVVRSLDTRIANTGQLIRPGGAVSTFRFSFAEAFVEFVGTMLPAGVSPYNPAYIFVTTDGQEWTVWAAYIDEGKNPTALWRAVTKPEWVTEVNSNDTTQDRPPRGGTDKARGVEEYRAYQRTQAGNTPPRSGDGKARSG